MKNLSKSTVAFFAMALSLPVLAESWYADKMEVPFIECTFESGPPMKFSQLGIYANYGLVIGSKTPDGRRSVFGSKLEITNIAGDAVEESTLFILKSDGDDGMTAVLSVEWVPRLEPSVTLELWSDGTQVLNETCSDVGVVVHIAKPSAR